ncbi:M15 family metallopeptidase [Maridesulfovibrio frigidus]|uniref:M15 family metallopeptidase n=1 Tax=Maridesulfovibrio frigidus TaxID=340956 RepID=UPI0004E1BFF9|nr:M15 family metallopeptidase [Maridesulfovibrio frigidus]
MNRRTFLKTLYAAATATTLYGLPKLVHADPPRPSEKDLKDYLHDMANFDMEHKGDIILKGKQLALLKSTLKKLRKTQRSVGFGNFAIISFDDGLSYARRYSSIGAFTKDEIEFMDYTFHFDAANYGFFGERPTSNLTSRVSKKELIKIPRSGNYLYRGQPHETYKSIKHLLGKKVYLTSGVRGIMKQFILFYSKAAANKGNLSLASRSLAPPGYSFHGIGDFDVGETGLGSANFSVSFAKTETCARLRKQGYLKLRYPEENMLGVRYEPWHIKVNEVK